MIRLAHFSDVHVTAPACAWRAGDWFNKRLSAWANLRLLGRGRHFRHGDAILAALRGELRAGGFDRVVLSGDATALGFAEETARAAELLGVGAAGGPEGLAVPGNHDYCTPNDRRAGHFEKHFDPWQAGERLDAARYPFAQRVGPAWLVAVNSATPNVWPWDATGAVGADQLGRLERLLKRLDGGPRILVTHYPVYVAGGGRESRTRRLRDLDALVRVAREGGVGLWLHGHRHQAYQHAATDYAPFPSVCAGSATQHRCRSYRVYTLDGRRLHARERIYDEAAGRFRDGGAFETTLPA